MLHAIVFSSVCSKCFICFRHMLQVFHLDVVYACMLQVYVPSVSGVFLSGCCICFAMATKVFSWCFRCMLEVFRLFRICVTSVSSRCCKVDLGVAYVAVGPICSSHLLQLLGLMRARDTKQRGPWCGRRTRCECGTRSKPGPQVKLAQQARVFGR
jgi:hypothetical protein